MLWKTGIFENPLYNIQVTEHHTNTNKMKSLQWIYVLYSKGYQIPINDIYTKWIKTESLVYDIEYNVPLYISCIKTLKT